MLCGVEQDLGFGAEEQGNGRAVAGGMVNGELLRPFFFPVAAYCLPRRRLMKNMVQHASILRHDVCPTGKEETVVTLKLNEQYGNPYENKGPASEAAV